MQPVLWYLVLTFFQLSSLRISYLTVANGAGNGGEDTTTTPPSSNPLNPSTRNEYRALQAWKSAIADDPYGILGSWGGPNLCSYDGVFCSEPPEAISSSPVVSGIDLNHANLKGSLVKELSFLTFLSFLHLNSNRFSGTIPDSFREFQYLTELDLSNNQFSGHFPVSTLLIPNLIYLDLRFNSFSGEVPDELFVKSMDAIFINNNQFEGQISMSLWASSASVITLANNKFSGSIPANFGYMDSRIREVLFLNNNLTGCIPEGLGFLGSTEVLDLSFNLLTGQLPSSFSCLSDIEVLNIGHNLLSGELPGMVCDLKSLINLTVAYNFFSGFSQDCDKLFYRNGGFDFAANCIPGRNMQRPPPQCMGIPVDGLSCLRRPSTKAMACSGSLGQGGGLPGLPYNSSTLSPFLP